MPEKVVSKKSERIHIMTSGRCNNNCLFCCDRFCCNGELKLAKRYLKAYGCSCLSAEGFIKESKKTERMDSILFTGGEPTLNENLLLFIRLAKKSGYKNISIQTNGRLLSYKKFCSDLIENGVNEINISIHASNKKIHDALTRSPGSFEQTYDGLCNAVALKRKYRFRINTNCTITRLNYKDIARYLKMLGVFDGIDSFVLNTPMYTGNAKSYFKQIFVSYQDIAEEVKKSIASSKNKADPKIQLSPMPFCLMADYEGYVGRFERPFEIRNERAQAKGRAANQARARKCLSCIYYNVCSGIDIFYAQRIGWSEFLPVKKK